MNRSGLVETQFSGLVVFTTRFHCSTAARIRWGDDSDLAVKTPVVKPVDALHGLFVADQLSLEKLNDFAMALSYD